jgi:putative (di)nucleoside polyphosphate hydrolase
VAGIVRNSEGRILICERLNVAGSWQFPQGGVDKGENAEKALVREMEEELSLRPKDYRIISKKGPYRYVFGNGRQKKGYHGQEQDYFLLQLTAPEDRINVATQHQEFSAHRWIEPAEFDLNWVPDFKREVYRAVMNDFFGVK